MKQTMRQMWENHLRLAFRFFCILCASLITSGCLSTNMFYHLAIAPNRKKLEFGNRDSEWAKWWTQPVVLRGEYVGKEDTNGVLMNHYQFAGLLNGSFRNVHIYLSVTGHDRAFAYEGDKIVSNEGKPAWLIINTHPNYPDDFASIVKDIQKQISPSEAVSILGGFVTTYGELCIFNVLESLQMESEGRIQTPVWDVPVSVDWGVRSKAMAWIRPVYAVPAAILCLPVDVVMWVYTPLEMCFTNLDGLIYVNMCEALKDD